MYTDSLPMFLRVAVIVALSIAVVHSACPFGGEKNAAASLVGESRYHGPSLLAGTGEWESSLIAAGADAGAARQLLGTRQTPPPPPPLSNHDYTVQPQRHIPQRVPTRDDYVTVRNTGLFGTSTKLPDLCTGQFPHCDKTGPDDGGNNRVSKNAFMNVNGQVNRCVNPATCQSETIVDRVADLSEQHYGGEDMCLWTYQALPPPLASGLDMSHFPNVTHTGVKTEYLGQPFYQYPHNDMHRMIKLCDMAANRLQSHVRNYTENGGAVPLSQCSVGAMAAKTLCNMGIEGQEGSFCDTRKTESTISWPFAVTMWRVNAATRATVKDIIMNWRGSPSQHYPNIAWVLGAKRPGETLDEGTLAALAAGNNNPADMNTCEGDGQGPFGSLRKPDGSKLACVPGFAGAHNPAWGPNAGLRTKVIPCKSINPTFMHPVGPHGDHYYGADAIMQGDTKTFTQRAYEEWDRHCAVPFVSPNPNTIPGGQCSNPPAESGPGPTQTGLRHYGTLPFPDHCQKTTTYTTNSIQCAQAINPVGQRTPFGTAAQFGNTSTTDLVNSNFDDAVNRCGQDFCQALTYLSMPHGTHAGINSTTGLMGCSSESYRSPRNCVEGDQYMVALRDAVECRTHAVQGSAQFQARLAHRAAHSDLAGASASRAACHAKVACDQATARSATRSWEIMFCENFFATIKDPFFDGKFNAVNTCADGSDGSTRAYCTRLIEGASATHLLAAKATRLAAVRAIAGNDHTGSRSDNTGLLVVMVVGMAFAVVGAVAVNRRGGKPYTYTPITTEVHLPTTFV